MKPCAAFPPPGWPPPIRHALAWLLLLATFWAPGQAAAQAGPPFSCTAVFYQIRSNNTQTLMLEFTTVGGTPTAVYSGLQTTPLNGLGYNSFDNYMYAFGVATGLPVLYRMGLSGIEQVATLVTPTGTPAAVAIDSSFRITGAAFDDSGSLYFAGQGTGGLAPPAIYRIEPVPSGTSLGNLTVTQVYQLKTTGGANATLPNLGDFSFGAVSIGPNGILYAATGTVEARIQLTPAASGTLGTATVQTSTLANSVGTIGSTFFDKATSKFYVYNNGSESYFEIVGYNTASPSAVAVAGIPYTGTPTLTGSSTDGTSCALNLTPPYADLSVTKSSSATTVTVAGQAVTFTVGVNNAGISPAYQVNLLDQMGAGFTYVSHSASAGTYTAATGLWNVGTLNVSTGASLTIVTTANTTGTSTLDYMNRVQVTQSRRAPGSALSLPDPDSTINNKTGTWVTPTEDDEAAVTVNRSVNLAVSKTNGVTTLPSGSTTGYSVTVANTGAFDGGGLTVVDPSVPGLNCTAVTPTCVVTAGTATCPATGTGPGELSAANLQGAGVLIPSLKAGATIVIRPVCTVTATGT